MAGQIVRSYAPPKASSFPLTVGRSDLDGIGTIEIDNGSALTLSVTADGQLVRTVTPYTTRFCINTGGLWSEAQITANKATIQATDSVTLAFYGQLVIPPLPPSFGVSSWGAGADPASLVQIGVGDQLLAWQVRQFYLFLLGVGAGAIWRFAAEGGSVVWRDSGAADYWWMDAAPLSAGGGITVFGGGGSPGTQAFAVAGALSATQRISSPATGASAKPLLNPVPISPLQISFTPTADGARHALTLTGVPASAVMVALGVVIAPAGAFFATIQFFPDNVAANWAVGVGSFGTSPADDIKYSGGVCGCSGPTIYYVCSIGGGSAPTVTVDVPCYWEAS